MDAARSGLPSPQVTGLGRAARLTAAAGRVVPSRGPMSGEERYSPDATNTVRSAG